MPVIPGVPASNLISNYFAPAWRESSRIFFPGVLIIYKNFPPKAPGRTETEDLLRGEQLQGIQGGQVPQGNHGQP